MTDRSRSAWSERIVSPITHQAVASLRALDVVVELVSPMEFAAHPNSGPMQFERMLGAGVRSACVGHGRGDLDKLRAWLSNADDLVLGWFNYDLKNLLEDVDTNSDAAVDFPLFYFFIPEWVAILQHDAWTLHASSLPPSAENENPIVPHVGQIQSLHTKENYVQIVAQILNHIQLGDIYEANFCTDHFAADAVIDPAFVFEKMVTDGQAPFSCRVAYHGKHLLCASPERFMAKTGTKVISQPIKGTNRRQKDNSTAIHALMNDPKERSENIMITDLVRNDLSKHAKKGTVNVEELCAVYPFAHVNQMISTVACELAEGSHPLDMLLGAFPMGSMTGAPKVRAMQLMDAYEGFGRGLFSGSVGYFTPNLDFDFNVVIRSILYDEEKKALSFPTGGAITINSDPAQEYDECMLKAESMRSILAEYAG